MYIATGDGDFGSLSALTGGAWGDTKSIGVLKSVDGGATWAATGLNWSVTSPRLIRRLIINPVNPQILLAATSAGIYRTTDAGVTWNNVAADYFMDVEFKPGNPSVAYATTYTVNGTARIMRSVNGGLNWFTQWVFAGDVSRINLAVTPANPELLEAVCSMPNGGLAYLTRSVNGGNSFVDYFIGTNTTNLLVGTYNASGNGGQGYYDLANAVNPNNASDIWIGGVNTWNSINAGAGWNIKTMWAPDISINPNNVPVVHADKHFLAFHPLVPGTLFECNDGGLYKTTNGGSSWTNLSEGLGISQVYRISASQTVSNKILCGLQDNSTKLFNANAWNDTVGTGDGMECIIDHVNSNIQYAASFYGAIYKTTGGLWFDIVGNQGGAGTVHEPGSWVTPFIMHPVDNNTLLVGKTQVYKTTDGGGNWSQLGFIAGADGYIKWMAYAPSDPNVIYASTSTQIFKSVNGGNAWQQVNGLASADALNTHIVVDPLNPHLIYTTQGGYETGDKVWRANTTTTTVVWTNFSGTLPNVPVNCIILQKNSDGGMYIGTDLGIYYRNNSMTDWTYFSSGLPNVIVTDLDISYNDNKIWAASFGRGLWKSETYTFTGDGNWTTSTNWLFKLMPGTTIQNRVEVIINPVAVGQCNYNGSITIEPGGKLTVLPGKKLNVTGSVIQQ